MIPESLEDPAWCGGPQYTLVVMCSRSGVRQSVFLGGVLDFSWSLLPICEMGAQGGAYLTDGIEIG